MTALQDVIGRVRAVCEGAITRVTVKALNTAFSTSQAYPHFAIRLGSSDYELESADMERRTRQIVVRYVIGQITAGRYQGETDDLLLADIDAIEQAFANNRFLDSTDYPRSATTDIGPQGARLLSSTGFAVFGEGGAGVQEVGAQFTISVPMIYDVTRTNN